MSVRTRLAGFFTALALVFGVAVGFGSVVGPTNRAKSLKSDDHGMGMSEGAVPQGLSVANDQFRLVAQTDGFSAGETKDFRFRIADVDGATVRDFDVEHTKRLHLIVVRRDLTRYVHVHPVQQADGSWSVPLTFADPGTYRVFADFTAHDADRATLGTDVIVPGASQAEPLPAPTRKVSVDGYDVGISGAGKAGEEREQSFTVTRNGQPVAVEPYLGADGHLVVLRQGDLAYLHAHNQDEAQPGPIRFMVEYPSAGRYRLFLQFQRDGVVHTAAFTQEVK